MPPVKHIREEFQYGEGTELAEESLYEDYYLAST